MYFKLIITIALLSTLEGSTRPKDILWVKCIGRDYIVPCKVTKDALYINGREFTMHIVEHIEEVHGILYFKLKDKYED